MKVLTYDQRLKNLAKEIKKEGLEDRDVFMTLTSEAKFFLPGSYSENSAAAVRLMHSKQKDVLQDLAELYQIHGFPVRKGTKKKDALNLQDESQARKVLPIGSGNEMGAVVFSSRRDGIGFATWQAIKSNQAFGRQIKVVKAVSSCQRELTGDAASILTHIPILRPAGNTLTLDQVRKIPALTSGEPIKENVNES
jgi:hypothetical protein